jgi:hypothetical protein
MEERCERGLDRTRRLRGIFDLELARFVLNAVLAAKTPNHACASRFALS